MTVELAPYVKLRDKLYGMKRDWLSFIAEAEARGDIKETQAFRAQLEKIYSMLESVGGDPAQDPPRRTDA